MPIFCQKRRYILKKHTILLPIFRQQTSILSNIHVFFFQFVLEKPPILMPIFGQRNVNSDKNTLYYGPKKSIDPFFRFFIKKYCSHTHIL